MNIFVLSECPIEAVGKTFLPDKIPSFLTDVKRNNFGYYEGARRVRGLRDDDS